ncbi:uncharacterized protein [Nicotiana tomentosiformis]|uniref:uncharacterized protein n=1 Tax=Nicotiana tomentosiformis TaxID=4098 RepID=UPI00388C79B7
MSKFTMTHGKRVLQVLEEDNITFNDADTDGMIIPHNDALVISLLIHDTNVKRVLIDLEEIVLTTSAEEVIKDTKFQVIDTDMAYNVILGRSWIHDMDVVPLVDSHTMNEDTNKNPVEDVVNQISAESGSRQKDIDFRPDVIQEPEENENYKTTIEELEAVVLFEQ